MTANNMEELVALCKRRGFIFQTNEIYGGLQGLYDYGPLGVELKNNLKTSWWSSMVYERDDVEGLDSSILTHPDVLKYSGHEETFTDPLVDCKECKSRSRADHIEDGKCPSCGSTDLTEPRPFNLMFKTNIGPIDDGSSFAYLRPETAQQIFINLKNVIDTTSRTLPFGVAQIGKAFRNEITPRNFIFRVREFEQMELEFFVEPGTDEEWHDQWVKDRVNWWEKQGIKKKNLELVDIPKEDLSHYSKKTVDIMYRFPHGLEELEGVANRTDFDIGSHTKNQKDYDIKAKVKQNSDSVIKLAVQDKINNTWTGDCWKLAYEIGLQEYKMQIIMIDFGIGIFRNLGKKFELNDNNFKKIKKLDFNFFYENYNLFNTISLKEFKKILKKILIDLK